MVISRPLLVTLSTRATLDTSKAIALTSSPSTNTFLLARICPKNAAHLKSVTKCAFACRSRAGLGGCDLIGRVYALVYLEVRRNSLAIYLNKCQLTI